MRFPGAYPRNVYVPDALPNPVSSGTLEVSASEFGHSAVQVQPFAVQPPSEDSLREEVRTAILAFKGNGYIPFHGWDLKTGMGG